jgi:HEAT repeat protein
VLRPIKWLALAAVVCIFPAAPARAYVDMAPTLARVLRDSQAVAVAEVDRMSVEKGIVILKKVRTLRGEIGDEPIKHRVIGASEAAIDRAILEWAEPGARCVLFVSARTTLVCMGRGWYQVSAADGFWQLGAARPDLPLAYYGTVSRLSDAVALMLANKSAVLTTLPHGADQQGGASFDLALNRANLPGLVKVQRIRADLRMPMSVMAVSANPAYLLGPGPAGEDEVAELRKKLQAADATVRAESAGDLGALGPKAAEAAGDLAKLLDDAAPVARMAGAAALLRVKPKEARALDVLTRGLSAEDAAVRRHAARAAGLAGPAAAPLADRLGALLADADVRVRRVALQAIATLGPAAAGALDPVTKLLDTPETRLDAAEALGRMGPAARPAVKRLARMLTADGAPERWAAVRAMSQIGGEDAAPAVQFMIRELRNARDYDTYNMLIYLALLGPVAKDAIPTIRSARIMNPFLRTTTIWAIEPDRNFPWLDGFGGGFMSMQGDGPNPARYVYESYVQELGDHLKPAAVALAKKVMDGTAGDVPAWGYKLLARFPAESLAILTPGLESKEVVTRERATVALGHMGPAAAAARAQVSKALAGVTGEKEKLLLRWCLGEIDPAPEAPGG